MLSGRLEVVETAVRDKEHSIEEVQGKVLIRVKANPVWLLLITKVVLLSCPRYAKDRRERGQQGSLQSARLHYHSTGCVGSLGEVKTKDIPPSPPCSRHTRSLGNCPKGTDGAVVVVVEFALQAHTLILEPVVVKLSPGNKISRSVIPISPPGQLVWPRLGLSSLLKVHSVVGNGPAPCGVTKEPSTT